MKGWLRRLGAGLIVLSFGLLLHELLQSGQDAVRLASKPGLLAITFAASLVYAALLALPAAAWACALRERRTNLPSSMTAVIIYARCNVLKYLPGNVFHFGGRQMLAHRAGWSHRSILMATTLEIVSLPLAAACVALFAFALAEAFGGGLPGAFLPSDVAPVAASLGLALGGAAALGAAVIAHRQDIAATLLAAMAALYIGFFAASAALVAGMSLAMAAAGPAELPMIAAAYLASWVIGFVVPGAPGGIGVREAAFVQLAAATVSAPAALALAIFARLVTSLGDLWFALFAHASSMSRTAVRHGG